MEITSQPPAAFSEEFLAWFRSTTETGWAQFQTRYFEDTEYAQFGSAPWQEHARWQDGLPDATIDELEQVWGVRFPPDHRLFLRCLHAPDRPPADPSDSPVRFRRVPSMQRPFCQWFGFYNWLLDRDGLQWAFKTPLEGLLFDAEVNNLWPASWGEKPETKDLREAHVAELVARAPTLIPILGHRYLLAEPCQIGNPVLSVHQSDMVIYGTDLRDYFLHEFYYFLDPERTHRSKLSDETMERFRDIPFWGEFL